MWLLRASPRGAQAHPSSPPSPAPAAVAAWDLGRLAFRTSERSAQLEVTISNYPPIPPPPPPNCKMCFCVGCVLGRVPLFVGSLALFF